MYSLALKKINRLGTDTKLDGKKKFIQGGIQREQIRRTEQGN
jgi:hypothetical protein